ncbi:DegQ family serine endoprotease [Massilia terrae]|uniref:Probable periplasmic serine endoprotease DegP-like n=1 Tax=Massilia terrae TaxID=1811224 RepID=A0ABT2CVM3_9BURK|nr:Do family serine endopeptidase [Massilia terrae]MCS0658031.1 Do family serine endopeptidase [Massilia terrae]
MQNEGASMAITAKRLTLALCAAGVIGGAVGAIAVNHNNAMAEGAAAAAQAPVAQVAPATAAPADPQVALPDFTKIVKRNGPAVVNVQVVGGTKTSARQRNAPQMDDDDPFSFFRQFGIPGMPRGGRGGLPNGAPTMRGEGSGFIVSADGVILTNAHVVRDADEVTVKLQDRREYRAKVLGSDAKTDVAVLKIEAKNLPVVPLGSTRNLQVGEWVLAIGSPYGLESTVTAGVVSAKGRSLPGDTTQFIQTDVAVNPGNSGGPLFNTRGEVVGINSQIYSESGGFQGLSFSIPIDVAVRVKDQILATGKVQHAKLGVAVQDVNQGFADSFKLDTVEGALVSTVSRGSPADKAGLKAGDVIRKVNGQDIVSSGDLPSLISLARPGEKVGLDVWRDGKLVHLNATLASDQGEPAAPEQVASADSGAKLGLALRPLDPAERRESGLPAGLVIEDAGGAAAIAGVRPGDVLLSVNGKPVSSVAQVRDVVAKSTKSVALLIQRGDDKIFIPVRIG